MHKAGKASYLLPIDLLPIDADGARDGGIALSIARQDI